MSKITYTPEPPITYTPGLIGCVQHDCAECRETAQELRRLEAENADLKAKLSDAEATVELTAQGKDELLEALQASSNYIDKLGGVSQLYHQLIQKHRGGA